jgi:plastocyanin
MRSLLISAVLGLGSLGVLGSTATPADAQWRWHYGPYASGYYRHGGYYGPWAYNYRYPYATWRYYAPYATPYYTWYYPPTYAYSPTYAYPPTYSYPSAVYVPNYWAYTPSPTYSTSPYSEQANVAVRDDYFEQPTLTVTRGTTVRWTNYGQHMHTVTAENGMFASQDLRPGEAYSYTFNQVGSFVYSCAHHPQMRGEVVVR